MRKHVVVIGAGIAGLTAAIYARRSGFDVTLIEQHKIAGGMCTSWKRRGYLFEGGVHWLTGSNPETEAYRLWRETGALDDTTPVLLHDPFHSVDCDGQLIHLYRDIDKTASHLIEISPEDAPRIKQLVKDVKKISKLQMPIFDVKGVKSEAPRKMTLGFLFKIVPALGALGRLGKVSCIDYVGQFKHPGLRRLFGVIPDRYTASSLIFTLATLHIGDGGYPLGGSLAMVNRMVKTFTDLGGTLMLNTRVHRVVIEEGVATGVELEVAGAAGAELEVAGAAGDDVGESGADVSAEDAAEGDAITDKESETASTSTRIPNDSFIAADAVIVTQETISALDALFDVPLEDVWLQDLRETTRPVTCTFVCVGVRTPLPGRILPEWELTEPITYADQTITELSFNNYCEYEGYAPEGCSSLTTAFIGDTYEFWKKAREEGRYAEEKKKLTEQIRRALCLKYPQVEGKIDVIDIATPLTYERYTGAYHGSWMAMMEPGDRNKNYPGYIESVNHLYFAGHRMTTPGGFPVAAASGRIAAQLVCRDLDVVFR